MYLNCMVRKEVLLAKGTIGQGASGEMIAYLEENDNRL